MPVVPTVAAECLSDLLRLAAAIATRENDHQDRFEALAAVHSLLVPELREALTTHTAEFLRHLIAEGLQWRSGRPATQVRQAAVLCLTDALRLQLLDRSQLVASLPLLLPVLKGCLNDDWAPELRLQSCALLQKLVEACTGAPDFTREALTALLERLDDAQDPVRIKAAEALTALSQSSASALSLAEVQKSLKVLLIHFDDDNPELQEAVLPCLVELGRAQPALAAELAQKALISARNPACPRRLLQLLQSTSAELQQ